MPLCVQMSYLIVDDLHTEMPELVKDQYWNMANFDIPYTEAALQYQKDPVLGSAVDVELVFCFIYTLYRVWQKKTSPRTKFYFVKFLEFSL